MFTGVLAEFYGHRVAQVVRVVPNEAGVTDLDQYVLLVPGLGERIAWDFQLTHSPPLTSKVYEDVEG
jgi:hypothetical protein